MISNGPDDHRRQGGAASPCGLLSFGRETRHAATHEEPPATPPRPALRPGIFAMLLDDVLDRLPADLPDAELSQFAEDPRVAEAGFLRNAQHQFAKVLPLRSASFRRLLLPFRFADPAEKRLRGDDRDQFLDGHAQRPAELEQPRPFLRFRVDFLQQSPTGPRIPQPVLS